MELGICKSCGKPHDELSFAVPVNKPTAAAEIPPGERDARVWTNGELYVVDDERFYVYGSIDLPIDEHPACFTWGAWAEVKKERFFWYQDLLDAEGRESNDRFAAALGTDIPFYSSTLGLPLDVEIQPVPYRPTFHLRPGDHLLIAEQQQGVSPERIHEIRAWLGEFRG